MPHPSVALPPRPPVLPIFIISYNRPTYLAVLLDYLAGLDLLPQVTIIDNASTWPPLLELYRRRKLRVVRLGSNMGHLALWRSRRFESIIGNTPFVLTDGDIVPDAGCPPDFLEYFYHCLRGQPQLTKVGFSLRTDDLPPCNVEREAVQRWEAQFAARKLPGTELYDAPIDTTFALYRPGIRPQDPAWWHCARTPAPYVARHLPWYEDSAGTDPEREHYRAHIRRDSSHWYSDRGRV